MRLDPGQRFLFLRHGETDYNRDGIRCGGEIDLPLNATGFSQAGKVGLAISETRWPVCSIATGSLLRTQQTANVIARYLNVEVEVTPCLVERRLGQWNGLPVATTEAALRAGETPPGGESATAFHERVMTWFIGWLRVRNGMGLIIASKGIGRLLSEELVGRCSPIHNCDLLLFEGSEGGTRLMRSPYEATRASCPGGR